MLNSRLSLLSAAALRRLPLSLGYGVILPSSLTTLLPPGFGFSPRPPVSVCGTGAHAAIAAFLGSMDSATSLLMFRSASRFGNGPWVCLWPCPLRLPGYFRSPVCLSSCVPTVLGMRSTGISASCPSATAFALALGPDLPWEDELYPGNLRHPP